MALALVGLACGGPPPTSADAGLRRPVGSACSSDEGCEEGLTCIVELPGGYCTRTCTKDCPGNSLCVQVVVLGTPGDYCAPICESQDGCRPAYQCISVGRRSVCGF